MGRDTTMNKITTKEKAKSRNKIRMKKMFTPKLKF